jgi:hypothetical protein
MNSFSNFEIIIVSIIYYNLVIGVCEIIQSVAFDN